MYTYARGEGANNPDRNGEYWLLDHVLKASSSVNKILLDVGANKGDWTAFALQLTRTTKAVHVHAFEPSPVTRSVLSERFLDSADVTVQPYALSNISGEAAFYSDAVGSGTSSLSPVSGLRVDKVKLITIDSFLQQSGLEAVSMLKIDTEGFDLLVLKGADKSLREGRIEIVQFEYNWRWLLSHSCLRDVFELISDKPYRVARLIGNALEFYDQWHFELDRYFETNYVLVRRDVNLRIPVSVAQFDESNTAT